MDTSVATGKGVLIPTGEKGVDAGMGDGVSLAAGALVTCESQADRTNPIITIAVSNLAFIENKIIFLLFRDKYQGAPNDLLEVGPYLNHYNSQCAKSRIKQFS